MKPMTDERTTEILEMAAEAEHAPRLKAEVTRLREDNERLKTKVLRAEGTPSGVRFWQDKCAKLRKVVEAAQLWADHGASEKLLRKALRELNDGLNEHPRELDEGIGDGT